MTRRTARATLAALRRRIDRVDAQILRRLNERARLALAVGAVKEADGKPVLDRRRETRVLRHAAAANRGPLAAADVRRIYREILRTIRRLEERTSRRT
ncbi:MAG TPA: chorismate mutase [bacterium]